MLTQIIHRNTMAIKKTKWLKTGSRKMCFQTKQATNSDHNQRIRVCLPRVSFIHSLIHWFIVSIGELRIENHIDWIESINHSPNHCSCWLLWWWESIDQTRFQFFLDNGHANGHMLTTDYDWIHSTNENVMFELCSVMDGEIK